MIEAITWITIGFVAGLLIKVAVKLLEKIL
jgi:hypothetical protein